MDGLRIIGQMCIIIACVIIYILIIDIIATYFGGTIAVASVAIILAIVGGIILMITKERK